MRVSYVCVCGSMVDVGRVAQLGLQVLAVCCKLVNGCRSGVGMPSGRYDAKYLIIRIWLACRGVEFC